MVAVLEQGIELHAKVRYGSMGKGHTLLTQRKWLTNFSFVRGRIDCPRADAPWRVTDVTGNHKFLEQLLMADLVIEENIPSWEVADNRFYLRVVVCYGKVVGVYGRSFPLDEPLPQRAKEEPLEILEGLDPDLRNSAESYSVRAASAMGLNFAGVDVMMDPRTNSPIVIEVNAFPGFPRWSRFSLSERLIREFGTRKWAAQRG